MLKSSTLVHYCLSLLYTVILFGARPISRHVCWKGREGRDRGAALRRRGGQPRKTLTLFPARLAAAHHSPPPPPGRSLLHSARVQAPKWTSGNKGPQAQPAIYRTPMPSLVLRCVGCVATDAVWQMRESLHFSAITGFSDTSGEVPLCRKLTREPPDKS